MSKYLFEILLRNISFQGVKDLTPDDAVPIGSLTSSLSSSSLSSWSWSSSPSPWLQARTCYCWATSGRRTLTLVSPPPSSASLRPRLPSKFNVSYHYYHGDDDDFEDDKDENDPNNHWDQAYCDDDNIPRFGHKLSFFRYRSLKMRQNLTAVR